MVEVGEAVEVIIVFSEAFARFSPTF